MPRRPKEKIDIDVVPYLSIMVIVLKLICLILIVTVMRIALNPFGVKAVSIKGVYGAEHKSEDGKTHIKMPTYFDCNAQGVTIFPGDITVSVNSLSEPGNGVDAAIRRIGTNATNEYAIVLVRPRGVRAYRYLRHELEKSHIDVGYDVWDADVKVDYGAAVKAAGIEEEKKAKKAPAKKE